MSVMRRQNWVVHLALIMGTAQTKWENTHVAVNQAGRENIVRKLSLAALLVLVSRQLHATTFSTKPIAGCYKLKFIY